MSQPGNINDIKANTATGALASNTSLNAAAKSTKSSLKIDNIAWRYQGFLTQTIYKKKFPLALWKRAVLFKDPNLVLPAVSTLTKLWDCVNNKMEPTVKLVSDHLKTLIQVGEHWTEQQIVKDLLSIYIKLSKTSPEIFGNLLTEKGALVKTEETIFWSASVHVLGENFELEKNIPISIATKL